MATKVELGAFKIPGTLSVRVKSEVKRESRKQAALALFRRGACSAGIAARMLGMRLGEFIELLKKEGLSYVDDRDVTGVSDRRLLRQLRAHVRARRSAA